MSFFIIDLRTDYKQVKESQCLVFFSSISLLFCRFQFEIHPLLNDWIKECILSNSWFSFFIFFFIYMYNHFPLNKVSKSLIVPINHLICG